MRGKFRAVTTTVLRTCSFNEARALCAGSSARARSNIQDFISPSMRPAHYAREVAARGRDPAEPPLPSMRPAHYAREVSSRVVIIATSSMSPSMRPAHYAREVLSSPDRIAQPKYLQ